MASFLFQRGQCYIVDIELGFFEGLAAGVSEVRSELEAIGLRGIQILEPESDHFVATGVWNLPSRRVELPSQVTRVRVCPRDVAERFKPKPPKVVISRDGTVKVEELDMPVLEIRATQPKKSSSSILPLVLLGGAGFYLWKKVRK